MPKVLIADKLSPAAVAIFKERGVDADIKTGLSKDELLKIVDQYDGIAIRSATKITADVIKAAKQVAVITLAMRKADVTRENWSVADACARIAEAGADVVGLNCIRGPARTIQLTTAIPSWSTIHLAALHIPFTPNTYPPPHPSLRH